MMDVDIPTCPKNNEQRLIHLDLKGAPPKLSYLEKIFPLFNKWGATGVLVEYEDMFPYSGNLQCLQAPHAYSESDIKSLRDLAASHNLSVVPLIQTFGHLEFILKHPKFHSLREISEYPMSLCPTQTESLSLIQDVIDQLMQLHPDIKWLHLGADEVFHIGACAHCQLRMTSHGNNESWLYLQHITKVARYTRERYPNVRLLIWDDMLRKVSKQVLTESGIGDLVIPMVWNYGKLLDFPTGMWERYEAVFSGFWAASAFKGATGPCMYVTDIFFHLDNHHAWLATVNEQKKHNTFYGFCLTGWQRYDHFAVMCELLPVGIPSLAACLRTLTSGKFDDEEHDIISNDLGFSRKMPLIPYQHLGEDMECSFPGSHLFCGVQALLNLTQQYEIFTTNSRLQGWMSEYHVKHRFANPAHLHSFLPQGKMLVQQLYQLHDDMKRHLGEIFFPDMVDEWLEVNINPKIKRLDEINNTTEELLQHGCFPKKL